MQTCSINGWRSGESKRYGLFYQVDLPRAAVFQKEVRVARSFIFLANISVCIYINLQVKANPFCHWQQENSSSTELLSFLSLH